MTPKSRKALRKKSKSLRNQCLDLWYEIIKKRAGYKSELSGKEGKQIGGESVLCAHHIFGKSRSRLAFDLANGICLTNGEHEFGVHHQGRRRDYEKRIRSAIGEERWGYLERIDTDRSITPSLYLTKLYLEQELRKLA